MNECRAEIERLAGAIVGAQRERVANYLRTCPVVIAIMEHTYDVLGRVFSVAGGSAIHTDGVYYWRRDAAEYVDHYGVSLPSDFLARGKRTQWVPPSLTAAEILAIDDYLVTNIRKPNQSL